MRYFVLVLQLFVTTLVAENADAIFFNGDIYTVNEKMPYVEAVAIKDGKIIFCGSKAEAFSTKAANTIVYDLEGKTMLPGFIDAHTHMLMEAIIRTHLNVDPEHYKTVNDVLAELKRQVAKGPVLALEYDPSLMTETQELGFALLDTVSKDVPVLVINKSLHIAYGNRKAFELAGITEDTKNPMGGAFERDKEGKLTGVADEVPAVGALVASFPTFKNINFFDIGKLIAQVYAKNGYTTITDMGLGFPMPSPVGQIETMRKIANESSCPIRIQGYMVYSMLNEIQEFQKKNTDQFKILGMKIWADGSIQGYTAALTKPYHDKDSYGNLNFSQKALNTYVVDAHNKGLQVAVHANGDKAIEDALNAFQEALEKKPSNDPRFRIEHCTVANPSIFERMVALKATPSFSEEHVYLWGKVFQDNILGHARVKYLDAAQTAKKLGLKFSFNDDVLGSLNPLLFIQVAVTRKADDGSIINPHERISVEEAIKAMTIYPAWQCFRDHELGSIEVGKFADFVVLDKNPTKVDPEKITDIKIITTYLAGKKRAF